MLARLSICAASGQTPRKEVFFSSFMGIKPQPQRLRLRHPQLEAAMVILRKAGYVVGEATDFDGEPLVAVDGDLRTVETVFEMVEDYNRKRA